MQNTPVTPEFVSAPNGQEVEFIPAVPSEQPPARPSVTADAKDKVFALLFFGFAALFCDFALFGGFNLGFAIATVLFFVLSSTYLLGKGTRFRVYPFLCGLMAAGLSVPFALHNDPLIRTVSFFAIVGLFAIYGVYITDSARYPAGSFRSFVDGFKTIFAYPVRYLFTTCRAIFGGGKQGDPARRRVLLKTFAGIACSVPVLAVVFPLMMRSNKYFQQLVDSISIDFGHLLVSVLFALLTIPFLFTVLFALRKKLPQNKTEVKPLGGAFDPIIVQSFLAVLSVVYLVYLLTQTAYFFSAFAGLLPQDYATEVADYARRGFFEMCAIAAINLGLLFATMLLVRKKEGKFPLLTKLLGGFLCVFTLLLIGTALSKMILYIDRFGLTRLRVLTSATMIGLALVFVAVGLRLFFRNFPYMKVAVVSVCLIGLALSFTDIDTLIAHYNVEAYQTKKLETVDVDTLAELSDGAVPYLIELTKDSDPEVARLAHNELVYRIFERFDVKCDCEEYFCGHDNSYYYTIDEVVDEEYDVEDIVDDGDWDESEPKITSVTPKQDMGNFREYNYDVAKALPLLKQYSETVFNGAQ